MSCVPAEEDRVYRWEITPHPYSKDFDIFVCDGDQEALAAIEAAAEQAWDASEEGKTRTITIKLNDVPESAPSE